MLFYCYSLGQGTGRTANAGYTALYRARQAKPRNGGCKNCYRQRKCCEPAGHERYIVICCEIENRRYQPATDRPGNKLHAGNTPPGMQPYHPLPCVLKLLDTYLLPLPYRPADTASHLLSPGYARSPAQSTGSDSH